ncbi:VRR-NUC domain-containing protein [Mesorhizobium sp. DCY119]|uniref:VRR-NUC domain-containing protein n=1 Tax=Mesorhizobium sp. DCY119 TaxID=2108445 RepID=UPI000E6B7350|nr:VRR-NUC domain-containing protein [Mesorhizobium sp. DCY119]RJG46518.1 VRR-NUC domain-containing protein [Mesorhizobium sp. DCY119]
MAKATSATTPKTTRKPTARTTTQTVRINGVRTKITTRNGRVTTSKALPLEWELQAAQVLALRRMPEYGKQFLLAGDMNSAKRGPRAQVEAIAAGLTPGEADVRIYLLDGRIKMFENKVGRANLTDSQKERHPALAKIGHDITVVRAVTKEDAAEQAVALVRSWIAANDREVEATNSATTLTTPTKLSNLI